MLIVEAVSEPTVICMQDCAAVHQDCQRFFLFVVTGSDGAFAADIKFVLDVYLLCVCYLQLPPYDWAGFCCINGVLFRYLVFWVITWSACHVFTGKIKN